MPIGLLIVGLLAPTVAAHRVAVDRALVRDAASNRASYDAAVAFAVDRVLTTPAVRELDDTALRLRRADVRRAVTDSLEAERVASILIDVHAQMVARVRGETHAAVTADLRPARRDILLGLRSLLHRELDRLPDCGVTDHAESLWDIASGVVTGESDTEILADLPECGQLGPITGRIENAIDERIRALDRSERLVVLGADEHSVVVSALAWADRWTTGWALALWLVLAAVACAFGGSRAVRVGDIERTLGRGMFVLGASWAALALLGYLGAGWLFSATAVRDATADIGAPLIDVLATSFALRLAGMAAVALFGAAWLTWRRTVLVCQIDTAGALS